MSWADVVAVVLFFGVTAYAIFGGADFGAGFWDLVAGGAKRGRTAARARRPLDRPGVGGQPRLADLLPRRALDRVRRDLRVDHADAVRPAHARRARHRPARLELRVPQGGVPHPGPPELRRRVRAVVRARPVLHGRGRRGDRLRPGARGRRRRRPGGQLDQPVVDPRRGPRGRRGRVPRGGLPHLGRAPDRGRGDGRVLPAPRGGRGGRRRARARSPGSSCCAPTPATSSTA